MSLLAELWGRRREQPVLVALGALLLGTLLVYPGIDWWLRANVEFVSDFRFGDFGAYGGAIDRWQAGESLYQLTDEGGFWGTYLYPPVVVLLFWPFSALLEFRTAAMTWVVATALVGIIKFAYAPVGAHLLHDRRRMVGALLILPPFVWLSIRCFGIEAHLTYVDVLRWGVEKGSGEARSPTLWLAPYFKPLGWVPAAQALRVVVCLGVAGLSVFAPPRARRTVFALGVATVPLFTPQTYAYYFVALLPATVLLLAGELDRDGRPELVLLAVLSLHLHSYGLKFLVHTVPDVVPAFEALRPAYLLLQPGLWGSSLLFGLAAVRVTQSVDWSVLPSAVVDGESAGAADE